jgi:hypothetical protein
VRRFVSEARLLSESRIGSEKSSGMGIADTFQISKRSPTRSATFARMGCRCRGRASSARPGGGPDGSDERALSSHRCHGVTPNQIFSYGNVWAGNFGFQDPACESLPISAKHNSVSLFGPVGMPVSFK